VHTRRGGECRAGGIEHVECTREAKREEELPGAVPGPLSLDYHNNTIDLTHSSLLATGGGS
jgi:hypothetical protein